MNLRKEIKGLAKRTTAPHVVYLDEVLKLLDKARDEIESSLERVNLNLEKTEMSHDDVEYHEGIKLGYEATLKTFGKEGDV